MKQDVNNFPGVRYLERGSKYVALVINTGLLASAAILTYYMFVDLFGLKIDDAIQDGLFILILLEMFYVIRSFIKYGSVNVSLVLNVVLIAAAKELIFRLDALTLQLAGSFAVILVSLGFVYFIESIHYERKKAE